MSDKVSPAVAVATATPPPQIVVESIMTANVQRITPEMSVREVIKILTTHKISGAPIVDTLGKVISVVSEGNLLKLAATVGLDKPMSYCMKTLPPNPIN